MTAEGLISCCDADKANNIARVLASQLYEGDRLQEPSPAWITYRRRSLERDGIVGISPEDSIYSLLPEHAFVDPRVCSPVVSKIRKRARRLIDLLRLNTEEIVYFYTAASEPSRGLPLALAMLEEALRRYPSREVNSHSLS